MIKPRDEIEDNGLPTISDWPTFYIYESSDGWHRSDARLTHEINRHVFLGDDFDTAGRTFYPQWPEPTNKATTKVAWMLNHDGYRVARWAWLERDHSKHHANCELTTNGKCRSRALIRLSFDTHKKLWTQVANKEITT